jgi:hypothetical protein
MAAVQQESVVAFERIRKILDQVGSQLQNRIAIRADQVIMGMFRVVQGEAHNVRPGGKQIDQARPVEQLQSAVNCGDIQPRETFARLSINLLDGLVTTIVSDGFQDHPTLWSYAEASLAQNSDQFLTTRH